MLTIAMAAGGWRGGPVMLGRAGAPADGVSFSITAAVVLIAIASIVGVVSRLARLPYTVALVVAGLGIAVLGIAPAGVHMSREITLLVFIPPLLFRAGLDLEIRELRRAGTIVAFLAIGGVLLSTFTVAVVARPALAAVLPPGSAWPAALLLGTIVAPTDPVSVLAVFRRIGVPAPLDTIVKGESIFNDGVSVSLFNVIRVGAAAAAAGAPGGIPAWAAIAGFLRVVGVGAATGLALGVLAFRLHRRLDDDTLETGMTVALAWGSYVSAEALGGSGIIAVVVAAVLMGNYGMRLAMSERTRTTLLGFWDGTDFVANSVVFLLVGLELSDPNLGGVRRLLRADVALVAAAALAGVWTARAALVWGLRAARPGLWPPEWSRVIWWAGMRGALSLALPLGLTPGTMRDILVPAVFLVVLVTLLGQALTVGIIVRRAGLGPETTSAATPAPAAG